MTTIQKKIVERVRKHLLRQKARASSGGTCVYRAPDGKRCAVGALIKDEVYCKEMEGAGVSSLMHAIFDGKGLHGDFVLAQVLVETLGVQAVANEEVLELLDNLQSIHDNKGPDEWESSLDRLARGFAE